MGLAFLIANERLCFTTIGQVEYQEGLTVLQEGMRAYRESAPGQPRVMFDIRQSTENRSAEDIRGIASVVQAALPGALIAIVVSGDLHFGMSRMFSFLIEDIERVAVFRDAQEAERWLG